MALVVEFTLFPDVRAHHHGNAVPGRFSSVGRDQIQTLHRSCPGHLAYLHPIAS